MIELIVFQETRDMPPHSQVLDLPEAGLQPDSQAPLSATAPLECVGVSGGASSSMGDGNQPSSAAQDHSEKNVPKVAQD